MNEDRVNQAVKLFILLSRAYRIISEQVDKPINKYGLNPTEFSVLQLLYYEGDLALQKIGEKTTLSSGSITYVVDKLEKKELLERQACPKDRRVIYAHLTDKGISLIKTIFPGHNERIYEIMSVLTKEEKDILYAQLNKLVSKVEKS